MFPFRRQIAYEFPNPLREIPPYRPTFRFRGEYINGTHAVLGSAPLRNGHEIDLGIAGWLRREDALKLYELAYFSSGAILEVGSYQGLSSSVIASAVRDSGRTRGIVSVEIDPAAQESARENLRQRGLEGLVTFRLADAVSVCDDSARNGARYGFVFVDHDHSYKAVFDVATRLERIVPAGGFVLFHDWLDSRNADPNDPSYGVYQATVDALKPRSWRFYGVFGVAGLFRRRWLGRWSPA
jgi:predicted O-methyltransferase YrrM